MRKDVEKALLKKALGYTAKEVVEEYSGEDGGLVKKKVSTKHYPPDTAALKALLEMRQAEPSAMSDEELEREKVRLLSELKNAADGKVADKIGRKAVKRETAAKAVTKKTVRGAVSSLDKNNTEDMEEDL